MRGEICLLERMALRSGCVYLSDLCFLDGAQRAHLALWLKMLKPREEERWEWNDALTYLTGAPPEQTAAAAHARLVELLEAGADTSGAP